MTPQLYKVLATHTLVQSIIHVNRKKLFIESTGYLYMLERQLNSCLIKHHSGTQFFQAIT